MLGFCKDTRTHGLLAGHRLSRLLQCALWRLTLQISGTMSLHTGGKEQLHEGTIEEKFNYVSFC